MAAYRSRKAGGFEERSMISSSNGRRFSRRTIHARCAHGHVLVPLNVWLLLKKRIAGPLYDAAHCLAHCAAFHRDAIVPLHA